MRRRKTFTQLEDHQKEYFYKIAANLITQVDKHIGDNFHGLKPDSYNIIVWFRFLMLLSKVKPIKNEKNCILPSNPPKYRNRRSVYMYYSR